MGGIWVSAKKTGNSESHPVWNVHVVAGADFDILMDSSNKVVAKLPRKVILMLEKAAILKNGRHLGFSVSQKKNSDSS